MSLKNKLTCLCNPEFIFYDPTLTDNLIKFTWNELEDVDIFKCNYSASACLITSYTNRSDKRWKLDESNTLYLIVLEDVGNDTLLKLLQQQDLQHQDINQSNLSIIKDQLNKAIALILLFPQIYLDVQKLVVSSSILCSGYFTIFMKL